MSVEIENGKAGKQVPSILNLQGREFEENPEAQENLDSRAEVAEEPLEPAEVGNPLPAVDVLVADKLDTRDGVHNSMPCGDESEIKMADPLKLDVPQANAPRLDLEKSSLKRLFLLEANGKGSDSGTKEEQSLFMKELEKFFRERSMEFKPPKMKGKGVNYLKLWRAVMRRGGYDKVSSGGLWGQVAKSFGTAKTSKAGSSTFRSFYEKALLDFEREKLRDGELNIPAPSLCAGELNIPAPSICAGELNIPAPSLCAGEHNIPAPSISAGELNIPAPSLCVRDLNIPAPSTVEPVGNENQASGPGRTPRDAATRARLIWHSKCSLGNGEVSIPIVKGKRAAAAAAQKRENWPESNGSLKRKNRSAEEDAVTTIQAETSESRVDDVRLPADEAKKNEQKILSSPKDCPEKLVLVLGLLPEFASMAQLKEAAEKALAVLQTPEQTLSTDTLDMLAPHLKVLMSSSAPIEVALACKRFEMVMMDQLGVFVEAKRRKIALEEEIKSTRESLVSTSPCGEFLVRTSSARKRLTGLEDRKRELEREISCLTSECARVEAEIEDARDELRFIDDLAVKERDRSVARERLITDMALTEMSMCQGDAALSSLKTMLNVVVNRFGDL